MLPRFYKIFFITLLIASGFLFLGNINTVSASATCACATGRSYTAPDDAITQYGGISAACDMYCAADGGATSATSNDDGTAMDGGETTADDGEPADPGPSVTMPNPSGITSVQDLFRKLVDFITPLALLFAGVMIIWSGFLFVTAQGDPTAITKAKQNFIWTVTGVAIVLASKAIVDYVSGLMGGAGTTGEGEALVTTITNLLNNQIIPLMFVLVTVYFFWGIITYVRAAGDQKAIDTGKQHMIYGIIGMAIMASAWGIVEMIRVSVM